MDFKELISDFSTRHGLEGLAVEGQLQRDDGPGRAEEDPAVP